MSRVTIRANSGAIIRDVRDGTRVLDVIRDAGVMFSAPCGGNGTCGKCQVQWVQQGSREVVPACSTVITQDCEIRLDFSRNVPLTAGEQAKSFGGAEELGAAVDLGTTTIALQLVSLQTGRILGVKKEWNAQIAYGGDVISRVQYTMEHPNGLALLCHLVQDQIFRMLRELCHEISVPLSQVKQVFLAGNTIMEHIVCGIDPKSIALAPYVPKSKFDDAASIAFPGLTAPVRLSPCVSGYVGGDIVAGLLASDLNHKRGNHLFLDIGTNGEMALVGRDDILCCSVACGPAFEGAEISCGMLGQPGAVAHISFEKGQFHLEVLGGVAPKGICGSGLIDLLAELLKWGIVDETGRLLPPDEAPPGFEAWLGEDENENGILYLTENHSIYFTAGDVRKLQLAKAAVSAGIQLLLQEAGLHSGDIDTLNIAGGFGATLNPASAGVIGMIPAGLADRVQVLGNTALQGAVKCLIMPNARAETLQIQKQCRYLELSGNPQFREEFIEQMMFEI